MRRMVQAGVIAAALVASAPAFACEHGHIGAGDAAIGLLLAPIFGVNVHVRMHHAPPCFERRVPVVVAPPVVMVPPPVVQLQIPSIVVEEDYVAPPVVAYAPPPPPPVVVAPAPVVVRAAPAPVVRAAPAPVVERRVDDDDRPATLAAKYLGGAVGRLQPGELRVNEVGTTGSFGLEYRVSRWFALRSDFEAHPGGRSFDVVGGKLWLSPRGALRPYGSVSLAASDSTLEPGRLSFGAVGAAGVDLFLGKHVFFEAEARYRVAPAECCRAVGQLSGHLGGGLAFF